MNRYFFHTESHIRFTDKDGEEHADVAAAKVSAARTIAQMLKDDASIFWGTQPWSMTVTNDVGLILFTIDLQGNDSPACPAE